ncbi:MAG: hypothetical protein ABI777_14320 [Betaproteobacteria bacterium]
MFYRVVLQGRTAGEVDMATVKREFARVTGMSEDVTERVFAQVPHPLKEGVPKADAERIAGTLRAIGAAVTVERDLLTSLDAVDGGVHELAPLAHRGPPTVAAGSEPAPEAVPPTAAQRLRKKLRPYLLLLLGAPLAAALLFVSAPYLDEMLLPTGPAPVTPTDKSVTPPTDDAPVSPVNVKIDLLYGPWRCTDQRTGISVFQSLGADGTFIAHGNTFKEGAPLVEDDNTPRRWELTNGRLVFTFANKPPVAYMVRDANLTQLRYGDGLNLDIQCRRP